MSAPLPIMDDDVRSGSRPVAHRRGDPIPFEDVARIVAAWSSRSGYGPHIAELFKVPVPTAYRWIAEARKRGLLPNGIEERPCRHCAGTGVTRWGKRQ